jgi:PAS domain S-box-containing protein
VALVATATAVRAALGSAIPGLQFISLFPAVIATTLACGMAVGFFSVALGTICAWFFILPPTFSFRLESVQQVYVLLFFIVTAGAIVVIIGAMRIAIDQARRLNQRLTTLNHALTTVFEANPDAILLADRSGRITKVNQRTAELFGRPRDSLIGSSVDSLLPERLRGRHVSLRTAYMVDPRPREMGIGLDLFALRGDGTEFPVDIQIGPIEIEGQTLAIATVRDLTEHKALRTALTESREQRAVLEEREAGNRALHTALESTTDSVIVLSRSWRYTYLNERAKAQFAHGRDLVDRPTDFQTAI